jgi:pimeloyl-ACP methyl ester carboxylesterase
MQYSPLSAAKNSQVRSPSNRRHFAQQAAIGLASVSLAACASSDFQQNAPAGANPTFVLVHGAWYGGWCWRKLVPLLERAGCEVHTPTLTGLGERAHLASREITLRTHVQDLQALLQMNDLQNVVLVGHSYAGMVISEVAQRERARLKQLIYLDAFVPEAGRRMTDYLLPADRRAAIVQAGLESGFVPPIPAQALGVTHADDLAWIAPRVMPQPFGTLHEPASVNAAADTPSHGLPRAYIACTNPPSGSFGQFAQALRQRPSWQYRELPTGHNAMVTAPNLLANTLLELAQSER